MGALISAPEPLGPDHSLDAFDSGRAGLDEWLRRFARANQAAGMAQNFVVCAEGRVVGFYSLAAGSVEHAAASERMRKGVARHPIPVMLLGRLAVDRAWQGRGVGAALLRDALERTLRVAEEVGMRAVLTHPIDDDARRFYARFDFEASPLAEDQMVLLIKDVRRALGSGKSAGGRRADVRR